MRHKEDYSSHQGTGQWSILVIDAGVVPVPHCHSVLQITFLRVYVAGWRDVSPTTLRGEFAVTQWITKLDTKSATKTQLSSSWSSSSQTPQSDPIGHQVSNSDVVFRAKP